MNRLLLLGAAIALSACRRTEPSEAPTVTTTVLAPPGGEGYEPTLAIDPANPDHLVAAAMNGMPPVGSSNGVWVWRTTDGGRTWIGGALATPTVPGSQGPQTFGADVVAAFATDSTPLLASMAVVGSAMGTFLSRMPADPGTATAVPVFMNSRDSATGATTLFDKDWLVVDRLEGSPHRGSVYLSTGALVMAELPEKLGQPWKGPLISHVDLAVSHDAGRTFGAPVRVSDSAFSAQLAVTPGGALEVTYSRVVNKQGSADAVFHRRSTDGGVTFGPPSTVALMTGDTLLDLPVLAARPNGDLLSCWSQGVRSDDRSNQVRCASRSDGTWSSPHAVDPTLPTGAAEAWPTIVGTARGWYLMQFVVTASRTEMVLYHSDDGVKFERVVTLATRDGLGLDHFCVNSVTPCRRSRPDGFTQGDYATLAAGGGRLVAAYTLPRSLSPNPGSAAVHISILAEPGKD